MGRFRMSSKKKLRRLLKANIEKRDKETVVGAKIALHDHDYDCYKEERVLFALEMANACKPDADLDVVVNAIPTPTFYRKVYTGDSDITRNKCVGCGNMKEVKHYRCYYNTELLFCKSCYESMQDWKPYQKCDPVFVELVKTLQK